MEINIKERKNERRETKKWGKNKKKGKNKPMYEREKGSEEERMEGGI